MKDYSQAKGLIFNIVHSSFVDGWGIRTTIFLKGCPLRCIWCCNPEGQSLKPELKITYANCDGCGACISACPQNALSINNEKIHVDRSLCTGCGKCCDGCFTDALGIFGTWYTAEQMFEIVKKDKPFYLQSGGGLTIGGGEATLYPEFCLGLIQLCHGDGIEVAIDTCGYVTSNLGMQVLKSADLLLFDIKGLDDPRHISNVKVSNKKILENLQILSQADKPIIVRMPIIPGYNDSKEELSQAAKLLVSLKSLKRLDILPVHQYGKTKYRQLDMSYALDCESISDERQQELLTFFLNYGLNAQIGG